MDSFERYRAWDRTPAQAIQIQKEFRQKLILKNQFKKIKYIAGCDMALDPASQTGYGGVIVYAWPELYPVEKKYAIEPIQFPYIPGLLSFREAPVLLKAFSLLEIQPDVIIFDGQGIAHPRGLGIAAHMGLLLDKPSLGCGKSKLYGFYQEPAPQKGSVSDLLSKEKQVIGKVLRSREGCNPVFISPGHKIDLLTSLEIILQCLDGFRIPKPTREADQFVGTVKREKQK